MEQRLSNILDIIKRHEDQFLADYHARHNAKLDSTRESRREYMNDYLAEHGEIVRSKQSMSEGQAQSMTVAMATRSGKWSADEDVVVMADDGRTLYQKAVELGRSYGSVKGRRRTLLGGVHRGTAA